MHRNYFLFERQVYSLNPLLSSCKISECFTHRRDELVIVLESDEKLYLRIGLNQQTPYILSYKVQVIKDPRIHFFKELWGRKIKNLKIFPYDKIVYITVDDFFLKCVFFGKKRNIFLLDSKKRIIQTFKKAKNSLNSLSIDSQEETLSPLNLREVDRRNLKENLRSYIMKRIGGFNKLLTEELCFRINLNPESIVLSVGPKVSPVKYLHIFSKP